MFETSLGFPCGKSVGFGIVSQIGSIKKKKVPGCTIASLLGHVALDGSILDSSILWKALQISPFY